ncbi:MAG: TerY-C metal binding domain-containing protein [Oligosphaeraceae bacterium]
MRRLPIFLVLDVSESMAGASLDELNRGVAMLQQALLSDPMAMETVYLSVIAFAGKAKVVTPLTYILDFQPPRLPIGAGTSLTAALDCLMHEIDTQVKRNTPESKGDWRPLVFILTDGAPNDRYQAAVKRWKDRFPKVAVQGVLMGEHSDATALSQLTSSVTVFKEATPEAFRAFFKWVSSSVQMSSARVGAEGRQTGAEELERLRDNLDADLLATEMPTANRVDYLVLPVRCQNTGRPYIVRFCKRKRTYEYDGIFMVDEGYFELSAEGGSDKRVSIEEVACDLDDCPYCGNPMLGYHHADGGHWLCLNPEHLDYVKCPWCGEYDDYGSKLDSFNGGLG